MDNDAINICHISITSRVPHVGIYFFLSCPNSLLTLSSWLSYIHHFSNFILICYINGSHSMFSFEMDNVLWFIAFIGLFLLLINRMFNTNVYLLFYICLNIGDFQSFLFSRLRNTINYKELLGFWKFFCLEKLREGNCEDSKDQWNINGFGVVS